MLSVNLPHFEIEGKTILRGVDFTLHAGENLTILGANGTGKSTLAKILCGLYKTRGAVTIDTKAIETCNATARAQKINYIPPKLDIFDSYITVEDFLQLSRYRQTPEEVRLDAVLELLGLRPFRKRYCSGLSTGEQQLLLIASALMHRAEITIFDEPTANLDPIKMQRLFSVLKSAHLKQKIVITHDLQFAYRLGDPVLYLHEGRATLYRSAEGFFSQENLDKVFAGSVRKVCDSVVVAL